MNLSAAERDAIASDAKAEARRLGLFGDAFWSYVWSEVENALHESGDLPRRRPTAKSA